MKLSDKAMKRSLLYILVLVISLELSQSTKRSSSNVVALLPNVENRKTHSEGGWLHNIMAKIGLGDDELTSANENISEGLLTSARQDKKATSTAVLADLSSKDTSIENTELNEVDSKDNTENNDTQTTETLVQPQTLDFGSLYQSIQDKIQNTTEELKETDQISEQNTEHEAAELSDLTKNTIKQAIKEKLVDEIREKLGNSVAEIAIPCDINYSNDESVQEACRLCKANAAFLLNAENWFKIGLVHNYRSKFSELLNSISHIVPDANFTATFGPEESGLICLASNNIEGTLTIKKLLSNMELPAYNLSDTHLFNVSKRVKPTLFGTIYTAGSSSEKGQYQEVKVRYETDHKMNLSNYGALEYKTVEFNSTGNRVNYLGSIAFEGELSLAERVFTLDYNPDAVDNNELVVVHDLQDKPERLSILLRLLIDKDLKLENLIDTKDSRRIFGYMDNFYISQVRVQIDIVHEKVAKTYFEFLSIPEFGLTPEIFIRNASGCVMAESNKSGQLNITGLSNGSRGSVDLKLQYTQSKKKLAVELFPPQEDLSWYELQNYLLRPSSSEEISQKSFFEADQKFQIFELNNFTFSNLKIQVVDLKNPAYFITADINKNYITAGGVFRCLTTNIGGYQNTFVIVELPEASLELLTKHFLKNGLENDVADLDELLDDEMLVITVASHDIDLEPYPGLIEYNPQDSNIWNKGVHVSYLVSLQNNCLRSPFCEFMKSNYPNIAQYHLSGELTNDGVLLKQELPAPAETNPDFQIQNTVLNVNILFITAEQPRLYLSHDSTVGFPPYSTIPFTGDIIFGGDNIKLRSSSTNSWVDVLNTSHIRIEKLNMHANINPNSSEIVSPVSLFGLGVYGENCFVPSNESALQFQSDRCLSSLNAIHMDTNNHSSTYMNGSFTSLTSYQALVSLANFSDRFIFTNVTKYFKAIKFNQNPRFTTALGQVNLSNASYEPGITVESTVTLSDISGQSKLYIDPKKKTVKQVLEFQSAFICHNNIALFRDEAGETNSLIITISEDTPIDNQVKIASNASLLGFNLNNRGVQIDEERIYINGSSEQLSGLTIIAQGTILYLDSFDNADLDVSLSVDPSGFARLEKLIEDKVHQWQDDFIAKYLRIHHAMEHLESKIKVPEKDQCSNSTCDLVLTCTEAPHYRCLEYAQKTSCKKQESYCTEISLICIQHEQKCIFEEEICIVLKESDIESNSSSCLETKTECREFIDMCLKYDYECIGDLLNTCVEYETVNDEDNCKNSVITCNEQWLKNEACSSACVEKENALYSYKNQLSQLSKLLEELSNATSGILEMNKEVTPDEKLLKIDFLKFEDLLTVNTQQPEISWQLRYQLTLAEQSSMHIVKLDNVDFRNVDLTVNKIFDQVMVVLVQQYSFDPSFATDSNILNQAVYGLPDNASLY